MNKLKKSEWKEGALRSSYIRVREITFGSNVSWKNPSPPEKVVRLYKLMCTQEWKLEDLAVLKHSPDLLNNVKIGQDQLRFIMKHILFYGGCNHFGQVTKKN